MKADINGEALLELGVKKGPMIGQILDEVLGAKMGNPNLDRQAQLELAISYQWMLTKNEETDESQHG